MKFEKVKVGNLCELITKGTTPTTLGYQFTGSGISFVKVESITDDGQIDPNKLAFIEPATHEALKRSQLKSGDILFTIAGTIGRVGKVPTSILPANTNQAVALLRPNPDSLNGDFLLYALRKQVKEGRVASGVVQAVQANFSLGSIRELELMLPKSVADQRKVVSSLCLIDAKIDINRRINQTLEAMAQAIFKSWFVDFDPVKAKITAIEQGEDPLRAAMRAISGKTDAELDQMPREQHDQLAATAALFPDAMEESELGEIPKGWTPTPIRDVAEVVKGKSYSSKDLVDNDQAALVTLKSFERGGGFRMDGFKPYVGPYKPEQVVLPGDLIVAYTDVTQAAELIGKPAVVVGVDHFKTLVASLDVGIIRPLNKRVSRQFLYGLFMTDAFQSHTFAHTSGTTVLHLSKEGVPSYSFACPDERLVSFFSETAEAMAMEKQRLIDQNRSLATLRDALLPKLLSGELSVENIPVEAAH